MVMEEPNRWLRGRWPRDHFTEGITYEHLTSFKPIDPERPDAWPLVNEKKQTRYDMEKLCRLFPDLQLHIPDYVTAIPLDCIFIGYVKDNTLLYYDTYIDKTWNRYAALGIAPDRVPVYSIDEEWKSEKSTRGTLNNDALNVFLPYEFGNKYTNYLDVNTIYVDCYDEADCYNEANRELVRTVLQSLKRAYGGTRTINVLKTDEFYFMKKETFKELMQSSNPRKEITTYLKNVNAWLFELETMGFRLTYAKPNPFGSTSTTVSACIEHLVNFIFDLDFTDAEMMILNHFLGRRTLNKYGYLSYTNMFFVNPLTTSYFDMLKRRHEKPKDKRDLGEINKLPPDMLDMIFQTQRYSAATLALLVM